MSIFEDKLAEHIKLREGFKDRVYLDSLGKPTAGAGHLLTAEERLTYGVGSTVPLNVLNGWFKADLDKALKAAQTQAKELRIESLDFLLALVSVNFQLGTNWTSKFPTAYRHIKNKNYQLAVMELVFTKAGSGINSDWFKQTPVRVQDFTKAIMKLTEAF